MERKEEVISWSAFLDESHALFRYSDSGMHRACFEGWEHQEAFVYLYRYQPLVDFEAPELQKMIEEHGMSPWLKAIKDFREQHESGK